ncbi:MAG: Clp protease N-terminal domain-containing protein [Hyphomicrobiaceae bacterium]
MATIDRAFVYAEEQAQAVVSLEHLLLLALTEDPDAVAVLGASGIDLDRLRDEVAGFVGRQGQSSAAGFGGGPEASDDFNRVITAASVAAERNGRGRIDGSIVLAALIGEGKSPAAELLKVHGLTFDDVVRSLQGRRAAAAERSAAAAATDLGAPRHAEPARPAAAARPARPPMREPASEVPAPAAFVHACRIAPASTRPRPRAAIRSIAAPAGCPSASPCPTSGRPFPIAPGRSTGRSCRAIVRPSPHEAGASRRRQAASVPMAADDGAFLARAGPAVPDRSAEEAGHPRGRPMPTFDPRAAMEPQAEAFRRGMPPGRGGDPRYDPTGVPPTGRGGPMAHGRAGEAAYRGPDPRLDPGAVPPTGRVRPPMPHPGGDPRQMDPRQLDARQLDPRRPDPRTGHAPHGAPGAVAGSGRGPQGGTEVGEGVLLENIPDRMTVDRPESVEVRIAKRAFDGLDQGLAGRGRPAMHDIHVTRAMTVRLRAPEGGFVIESHTPETQWIENTLGLLSDDFASWRFTVTPRQRGRARLQVIVSAKSVGPDGLAADTALPDQTVEVAVRANYGRAARRAFFWLFALLSTGLAGAIGEALFSIIRRGILG